VTRIWIIVAAAGVVLPFLSGFALAQGSSGNPGTVVPFVPHHKVTPSRYMQHPRPVPEPQTIDALNAMSLDAARRGVPFVPPPPGNEH
jgi:hypothetical protein